MNALSRCLAESWGGDFASKSVESSKEMPPSTSSKSYRKLQVVTVDCLRIS